MSNEIVKVNASDFELTAEKATEIETAFSPKIAERKVLAKEFEEIIASVIDEDLSKKAGTLRKKLVKVRTGMAAIHKTQKNMFLQAGRFVDAWKNAETLPVTQMEEKLAGIEKHFENIEKERIEKLNNERKEELEKLGCEFIPAGLAQMEDKEWEQYLWGQKIAKRERDEAEKKAEAERIARELEEEAERERIKLENERLKAEAVEREKEEANRKAKANAELKRIEAERAEELKELARVAAIKEEADRVERERLEDLHAKQEMKLAEERKERERLEREKAKAEAEEKAKKSAETARQKDKEHRAKINKAAMNCFIDLGLSEDVAKSVIKAIALGKIENVSINY